MEYYDVKFLSDMDYGYNKLTGEYDVPMVEWESDHRWWERFDSEEARHNALRKNEEYNNRPEVSAFINKMNHEEEIWRTKRDVDDTLEYYEGRVAEFANILSSVSFDRHKPHVQKVVADMVVSHNKPLLKAKRFKVATQCIGDFL
jgi:hypothetical protein